jgi:hypothetical protein
MLIQTHIPVGTEIIVKQHDTADEAERLTLPMISNRMYNF